METGEGVKHKQWPSSKERMGRKRNSKENSSANIFRKIQNFFEKITHRKDVLLWENGNFGLMKIN
ncbi:hypothetical protein D1B33_10200 [Lysinibacillus yapensis]|uniref:Uncharacterized protein n=1 Tax=Ureibacillus yapensis TaxID=2304605 RepID=A0A396SDU2_9BACL|nr:hypothetical protein D1B33_10200 [Lysinibacillus yapensis]